jgi:hypothetical protein
MHVEQVEIDSRVLGRNVLAIQELDTAVDFRAFEDGYIQAFDPAYVYCKTSMDAVGEVHYLESNGFNFIECQIRAAALLKPFNLERYDSFVYERITQEHELEGVIAIAGSTFTHDRWRMDPQLDPGLAGERYRQYLYNSFRDPKEFIFRLCERATGRTLAFQTNRIINQKDVLFLLIGVHPDFKNQGLGVVNEYFAFNELVSMGFRKAVTHLSAANYPMLNLNFSGLGFKVTTTFAVLRKLYGPIYPR